MSLDHYGFASLLCFANAKIGEANWEAELWDSLGRERLVRCAMDEGLTLMFAADVDPAMDAEPQIPKIAGEQAALSRTVELQTKVRQILTRLAGTTDRVYRRRNGQNGSDWVERAQRTGKGLREADVATLPWDCTHFEERQSIRDMIKQEFNVAGARSASIDPGDGFICFDDEAEDASNTLAWVLMSLLEAVFDEERRVLRRCPFCEGFFIHRTMREKRFCSGQCRFNFHNKGLHTRDERG